MDERQENVAVGSQERSKAFAKESWITAEQRGNGLLPQSNLGLSVTMLDQLFTESHQDPTVWQEFFASSLSPEQLAKERQLMENMHNARGIKVQVADSRIQNLYSSCKRFSQAILHNYLDSLGNTESRNTDRLQTFLTGSENLEQRESLEKFVKHAKETLFSDEVKQLANEYKKTFDRRRDADDQDERLALRNEKLHQIIERVFDYQDTNQPQANKPIQNLKKLF